MKQGYLYAMFLGIWVAGSGQGVLASQFPNQFIDRIRVQGDYYKDVMAKRNLETWIRSKSCAPHAEGCLAPTQLCQEPKALKLSAKIKFFNKMNTTPEDICIDMAAKRWAQHHQKVHLAQLPGKTEPYIIEFVETLGKKRPLHFNARDIEAILPHFLRNPTLMKRPLTLMLSSLTPEISSQLKQFKTLEHLTIQLDEGDSSLESGLDDLPLESLGNLQKLSLYYLNLSFEDYNTLFEKLQTSAVNAIDLRFQRGMKREDKQAIIDAFLKHKSRGGPQTLLINGQPFKT